MDGDGDSYGSTTTVAPGDGDCNDAGESAVNTDCNDGNPAIHPGATEVTGDAVDQDCNGADTIACVVDADHDGSGTLAGTQVLAADGACNAAQGESVTSDDCADSDPATHPGAPEACDGNDNVCAGVVSAAETDPDGDGFAACAGWSDTQADNPGISGGGDCDPADPDTFPGAASSETFPQLCMRDKDGDGYGDITPPAGVTAGGDCDDDSSAGPVTFPGAAQIEGPFNCMKDADDDGWGDMLSVLPVVAGSDCADTDPSRHPTAPDTCGDGVDSNCDGSDPGCLAPPVGSVDMTVGSSPLLSWSLSSGAAVDYCVYRGDLAELRAHRTYTQEPGSVQGAAQFCGLQQTDLNDAYTPAAGHGVFYLITARTGTGETGLGVDSAGALRPNEHPCDTLAGSGGRRVHQTAAGAP